MLSHRLAGRAPKEIPACDQGAFYVQWQKPQAAWYHGQRSLLMHNRLSISLFLSGFLLSFSPSLLLSTPLLSLSLRLSFSPLHLSPLTHHPQHQLPAQMGVPFLWPLVQKKGYTPDPHNKLPTPDSPSCRIRVDVLGSFFSIIRRTYVNNDLASANNIFEHHLRVCQLPQSITTLYLDGQSPKEKHATQLVRTSKRHAALEKAGLCLDDMEATVQVGKKLKKQHHRKLAKFVDASFYFTQDFRRSLAHHLRDKGWAVIECPSEADIAIARDCTSIDVVLSADSDALIHPSVCTIWRPQRTGYLAYDVARLLQDLGLSKTGLTTLGVVSRNDYTSNLPRLACTQISILSNLWRKNVCSEGRLNALAPCCTRTDLSFYILWMLSSCGRSQRHGDLLFESRGYCPHASKRGPLRTCAECVYPSRVHSSVL